MTTPKRPHHRHNGADPRNMAKIYNYSGPMEAVILGRFDPNWYELRPRHGVLQSHIDRPFTFLAPAPDYTRAYLTKFTIGDVPDEERISLGVQKHEFVSINPDEGILTTRNLLFWDDDDFVDLSSDWLISQELAVTYLQFLPDGDRELVKASINQMTRLQNWMFSDEGRIWLEMRASA